MKKKNKNADLLNIGIKLLDWYQYHARELPWRETQNPYHIWISEVVLQQTRVEQGKNHYIRFIERFPNVSELAKASNDEVLLYWKGLGYYSRAINLHKAAQQIVQDYNGKFPESYDDILKLKGIGKYTAAAISSICFQNKIPAIDGNFYRVLSRLFADDFDISQPKAFNYFHDLALRIMPENQPGEFNQAVMDLGSNICKPKNPICSECPLNIDCLAFQLGKMHQFPIKSKKVKSTDVVLHYYFIQHQNQFIIKQRNDDFIWKRLYDFPENIDQDLEKFILFEEVVSHKLTHKNLEIHFYFLEIEDKDSYKRILQNNNYQSITKEESQAKSFPKPLQSFIEKHA